jgi:hypothetical protein
MGLYVCGVFRTMKYHKTKYINVIIMNKAVYIDPATCVNCDDDNKRGISGSKDHSGSVWSLDREDFVDYSLIGHTDYIV